MNLLSSGMYLGGITKRHRILAIILYSTVCLNAMSMEVISVTPFNQALIYNYYLVLTEKPMRPRLIRMYWMWSYKEIYSLLRSCLSSRLSLLDPSSFGRHQTTAQLKRDVQLVLIIMHRNLGWPIWYMAETSSALCLSRMNSMMIFVTC